MDYARHYAALIHRARGRSLSGYSERHHIVPRCMSGGNEPENIVRLTAEEHFVAHQLLVKIFPEQPKLVFALVAMVGSGEFLQRNNKMFAWHRRRLAALVSATLKGKPKSAAHRVALSRAKMGKSPSRGSAWKVNQAAAMRRIANSRDLSFTQCPKYRAGQSEKMKRVWAERRAAQAGS